MTSPGLARPNYTVAPLPTVPAMDGRTDGAWAGIVPLEITHFHARSSAHRPQTRVWVGYQPQALHLLFHVEDRYVRCVHTHPQDSVCRDSCVEAFLQPTPAGYFNFEINCGGTLLLYYITDPSCSPEGSFRGRQVLTPDDLALVQIAHALPARVEPERAEPLSWWVQACIPLALLERYAGPLRVAPGVAWRANFYKCADDTSMPHWASWSPIGPKLNFHCPEYFGELHFTD